MPRCLECNEKFVKKYPNQMGKFRFCMVHDECIKAFNEAVSLSRVNKAKQQKSKHKKDNMSTDNYRKTYIQPLINHIARLIDHKQTCICTDLQDGKMNGGHRHSTGSNRTLTYNLHNVHNQSFHSNHHQSGDHLKYRVGLKRVYGVEYADFIDEKLMQCPTLHITKQDLVDLKPVLEAIRKRLISLGMTYTPKQRVRLRNELNKELGIYPTEYSVFKK